MSASLTAFLVALLLLFIGGIWHLIGIRFISRIIESLDFGGNLSVLIAFWGLGLLHLTEIGAGAAVYQWAIGSLELGSISKGYGDSWVGLLYFSGISFTSLGYTQQNAMGPVRLIVMMQALMGFMLITWSATFVYSIWQKYFRD